MAPQVQHPFLIPSSPSPRISRAVLGWLAGESLLAVRPGNLAHFLPAGFPSRSLLRHSIPWSIRSLAIASLLSGAGRSLLLRAARHVTGCSQWGEGGARPAMRHRGICAASCQWVYQAIGEGLRRSRWSLLHITDPSHPG